MTVDESLGAFVYSITTIVGLGVSSFAHTHTIDLSKMEEKKTDVPKRQKKKTNKTKLSTEAVGK